MDLYTGPWAYSVHDKTVPASVRLRNIGAIGSSKGKHERRFGALSAQDLPASDGTILPTPAFAHVYGGAAYWGHYVIRRAFDERGFTSIAMIMDAYATGHSATYKKTISRDVNINSEEQILLFEDEQAYHKLYRIMIAMGRWEAGARHPSAPGYEAFHIVYNLDDQLVVDELFWGMVHGIREGLRDRGYKIKKTREELGYVAPEEPRVTTEEGGAWWRTLLFYLRRTR